MRLMKFVLAASAAIALTLPAAAQTYKPEYKISTVVGAPFPWGLGAERWAASARKNRRQDQYEGHRASLVGGDQTKEFTDMRQGDTPWQSVDHQWSPQA